MMKRSIGFQFYSLSFDEPLVYLTLPPFCLVYSFRAVVYTTEGGLKRYATEVKLVGLGDCHWTVIKELRKGALDTADLQAKITADEKVGV